MPGVQSASFCISANGLHALRSFTPKAAATHANASRRAAAPSLAPPCVQKNCVNTPERFSIGNDSPSADNEFNVPALRYEHAFLEMVTLTHTADPPVENTFAGLNDSICTTRASLRPSDRGATKRWPPPMCAPPKKFQKGDARSSCDGTRESGVAFCLNASLRSICLPCKCQRAH